MKRFLGCFALLVLGVAISQGADLTGKWKGTLDAGGNARDITIDLKDSDGKVAGTVGGLEKPADLKEGKVSGDTVTFWFTTEYQGQAYKLICKGKLVENEIRLSMGLEDGGWSTDLVLKKSS
jgi:hypothetical protein